jgi:Flp pilus assembly protein TadB
MVSFGLTGFEAYAMSINTCLGAGFLAVPWVFQQIGFFSGLAAVFFFWMLSTITAEHMVEAISRAEVILSYSEAQETPVQKSKGDSPLTPYARIRPTITDREIPVAELIALSLGPTAFVVYTILLYCSILLSLSVFFSIFASS